MKYALTIALLLLAVVSHAHEPRTIAEHQSEPGETKDAFLQRVATFQHGWSHHNNAEACGLIARRGDAHSVITQTIGSQVECASRAIYAGWEFTGETIHSHPALSKTGVIMLSQHTKRVSAPIVGSRTHMRVARHTFSEGDYLTGCGYLADNGLFFYQCGKGTQRLIAQLD